MKNISDMSKNEINTRFRVWRFEVSKDFKGIMNDRFATLEQKTRAKEMLERLYPVIDDSINPLKVPGFVDYLEKENEV